MRINSRWDRILAGRGSTDGGVDVCCPELVEGHADQLDVGPLRWVPCKTLLHNVHEDLVRSLRPVELDRVDSRDVLDRLEVVLVLAKGIFASDHVPEEDA
eukprot:CAMPEP_0184345192 /NCGR_PEP_ID=MMETSP1089-20130417/13636_1 /TAXON_ID=38269 ORGANISM="Gloeochaete wittrockiana, Strain SAG46.84" /NCGR_SAMPLE_ID=MMETSP1089 /ASSEMBLY_ACC=CAM_ASM_000445 /LENGTH=99 /DNA_ID=CAMNT_0026675397 /DNA_START=14 /DNA_END=310 /DNA_ORIENTATION=-